ncbi:hypothetical protein WU86_02305 [Corynebacterium xerosis]|nr:hypothetical protein WU86_02305 [Corynebacterium xerosis]
MDLQQIAETSSKTARTMPSGSSCGSTVNVTPAAARRACSARTSSTSKVFTGMPSANRASLNGATAGWPSGSRTISGPSGRSGETTVNQDTSGPMGMSCLTSKPRISV